jgi:hypothetical protein
MMLGIFLIYFIWKRFAELAEKYDNKKWVYGLFGVITYYVGTFLLGIFIAVLDLIFNWDIDWEAENLGLSLLAFPFGLGACYLLYYLLKRKWEKEVVIDDSIEDIGKITIE